MNILVTGAEGNIGWYMVRDLKRIHPEAEVIGTTRKETDLTDRNATVEFLIRTKPDYVIHTAAKTYNADLFKNQPYDVFAEDASMILNVIDGCVKAGVKKIVYLSSATVYEGVKEVPFKEHMVEISAPPTSPIGLSKLVGERALDWASKQHGIDFTIWRLFNVVSPREPHDKRGAHVYVEFFRQLFVEKTSELTIFGNGNQERCFTWVEDVSDAVSAYLTDDRTSKQTLNIGGNEPCSLLQLEELMLVIGKEQGQLAADYIPTVKTGGTFFGVDAERRFPSLEKIDALLSWKPRTGLRACFEKYIAAKQS